MGVVVVTPPALEPVSTGDAAEHLRVSGDDVYIASLVIAAREYCEKRQARAYITQTLRLTLDAAPDRIVELPRPPLVSVTSIVFKDENGTTTTVNPSAYIVDTDSTVGRVALKKSASWPTVNLAPIGGVSITFVAGYGDEFAVPERTKHAMKLLIGHWYENREAVITGTISKQMEFAVDALLGLDRVYE